MENKINWKQKLTSRKLWVAIVGVIVGMATTFGLPESEIAQVAGSVVQAMSIVAYIIGEAKVDAAAAKSGELSALFGGDKQGGDKQGGDPEQ